MDHITWYSCDRPACCRISNIRLSHSRFTHNRTTQIQTRRNYAINRRYANYIAKVIYELNKQDSIGEVILLREKIDWLEEEIKTATTSGYAHQYIREIKDKLVIMNNIKKTPQMKPEMYIINSNSKLQPATINNVTSMVN